MSIEGFLTDEQSGFLQDLFTGTMEDTLTVQKFSVADVGSPQSNGRGGFKNVTGSGPSGMFEDPSDPYPCRAQLGPDLYGFGERFDRPDERNIGTLITTYDCPVEEKDKVTYRKYRGGVLVDTVDFEVAAVERHTENLTTYVRVTRII